MDRLLAWILPEILISSFGLGRRKVALILGSTVTFTAVIAVVCFVLLGKEEATARDSAALFGSALVHDDPAAAPPGGAAFVSGVRHYFGPVRSARVIGAHNKGVNTGDNADTRSFFVVQMLLATKRGPAVIELEYDNHALLSQKVSRVYELEPGRAPGLSEAQRTQLESAFDERGAAPADAWDLSRGAAATATPVQIAPPALPKPAKPHIAKPKMPARLRCVQRAQGDVQKLQKCAAEQAVRSSSAPTALASTRRASL
jgi:hypothetical protein